MTCSVFTDGEVLAERHVFDGKVLSVEWLVTSENTTGSILLSGPQGSMVSYVYIIHGHNQETYGKPWLS